MQNWCRAFGALIALRIINWATLPSIGQGLKPLEPEQRRTIDAGLRGLQEALASLGSHSEQSLADATIYAKGLTWALRYDNEFTPRDLELFDKALMRAAERTASLEKGAHPWCSRTGKVALGYVSKVDGSVQPYGLIVPRDFDPTRAMRLDVVLHGSMQPIGMSELRFMDRFDETDNTTIADHGR